MKYYDKEVLDAEMSFFFQQRDDVRSYVNLEILLKSNSYVFYYFKSN